VETRLCFEITLIADSISIFILIQIKFIELKKKKKKKDFIKNHLSFFFLFNDDDAFFAVERHRGCFAVE
jgi:hypothetical protein